MTKFLAHHSAISIKQFFRELPDVEADRLVDKNFFKSIGYKGDTPAEHTGLLTALGFIGSDGYRTSVWEEYERGDSQAILRREIKRYYSPLFRYYPEAHLQSAITIRNWIHANTGVSRSTAERAERTFRILCKIAKLEQEDASKLATFSEGNNLRTTGAFTINLDINALGDPDFLVLLKKYAR